MQYKFKMELMQKDWMVFVTSNALDAKSLNLQGADCTGSDVVCLGDAVGTLFDLIF